jgi:bifunctional non-homologous end joining protein LigD
LATLADAPPTGNEWLHEIKLDGYRLICRIDGSQIQFLTRNKLDWSHRLASLVKAIKCLPLDQAILDGEVVIFDDQGVTSFQHLQNALHEQSDQALRYFAFDLLYLNGEDLQSAPLEERRRLLENLIKAGKHEQLQFSENIQGDGPEFFRQCARRGLEGMISKRRSSPYTQGRSTDWIKSKCVHRDEFVIGGFTRQTGDRDGFETLLLGHYDAQGNLIYVGQVGAGFSKTALLEVTRRITALRRKKSPFASLPEPSLHRAQFIQPKLVGQIEFAVWTPEGLVRDASFQGLREDLPPTSVTSIPKNAKSTRQRRSPNI